MKKIVKLSLIAILLAVVAIAITGCGAEEKDRTYNTLGKTLLGDTYILEIEGDALGGNGKSGTLTVAKKGDKILQEVKSDDGKVTIIFKDNATHIVIHDEKMYMKTEGKDESILSDDEAFLSKEELEALKTEEYKTGKEKIDDKEYYYEEYHALGDEITERYYFDGNELKYVKSIDSNGKEQIIKVVKLSSKVDDSVFDIPTDYELIEE